MSARMTRVLASVRRPGSLSRSSVFPTLAVAAALATLAGCDVKIEKQGTPATATKPSTQSTTVVEGGGSSLGKAKGAAENIRDKTEDYNKKLEEQIDDISNPK
ncbi:MAG: hypothetical protein JNM94_17110 [Phycisphaerae bacterium]|nr:hypothetical protein [Phycisphaerae bacterium]